MRSATGRGHGDRDRKEQVGKAGSPPTQTTEHMVSTQAIGQFVQYIASDQSVATDFVRNVETKQGEAAYEAVSAFARERGFDLDIEDARKLQQVFLQTGEISDEELQDVVGGAIIETAMAVGAIAFLSFALTAPALSTGGILGAGIIANAAEGRAWNSGDNVVMTGFINFMRSW